MSRIIWDQVGEKIYETGVDHGVLYPQNKDGSYPLGVAWNGLISVSENPSGAEPNALYADNQKYLNLMSAEDFGVTIEAYTYPKEWKMCDGRSELTKGVAIGQQPRTPFGMSYRTIIGNDTEGEAHGYLLHIFYNGTASTSERAYSTTNDSPEAITFSWEVATTPVPVTGHKPTASLTIDSRDVDPEVMKKIEDILYGVDAGEGSDAVPARLPLPDEIINIMEEAEVLG